MRSLLLVILLVVSGVACEAQAQDPMGFGFKAGCVGANQDWKWLDYDDTQEVRWGGMGGVFVDVVVLPHFMAIIELDYVEKGITPKWKETTLEGVILPVGRPHVAYLSVPLLAKIHADVGRITPYLVVGPTVDFPVNTYSDGSDVFRSYFDKLKKVDIGAVFGFGVELRGHAVTPLAEFRYCHSLNKAVDTKSAAVRNHYFGLLLGVRI